MKFRFNLKHFLSFTLFIFSFALFSQQSIVDASVLTDFNNGIELYNNKSYAAAQKTFEKVQLNSQKNSSIKADASYYNAMCAIKLNQTDADKKVLSFVENNPISNKKK